jgi:hypothetical protein
MESGQMVKLRVYGDKEVALKFVRQIGETLVVCQAEEYELANLQKRDPRCIGFNIKYLIKKN